MSAESSLKRPGFGLPLYDMPQWPMILGKRTRFPHAIIDYHANEGVTLREQCMLDFIGQITDKPRWQEKIYDENIVAKWQIEACGTPDEQETSGRHLSKRCFDYCMSELRDKANYLQKYGVVHVLDVDVTIVKADLAQTDGFCDALRRAVKPLEEVRENLKDWHPGSNGLVLDLVHPSLFPLDYSQSRVLSKGTVDLLRCSEFIGRGQGLCVPDLQQDEVNRGPYWSHDDPLKPWGSFQWLPSEISFNKGIPSIHSYINNLHPQHHPELYVLLTSAVDKAVPLWNECLSWFHNRMRIEVSGLSFEDFVEPKLPPLHPATEDGAGRDHDDDDDDDGESSNEEIDWEEEDRKRDWLMDHAEERRLYQPNPSRKYMPFEERANKDNLQRLDLRTDFPDGLQVIFKLANIHLTPEKPEYHGSNWHVEGALNEHICATALFYYDQDNITDSHLEFRQKINSDEMTMKPAHSEYAAAEDMYGIENGKAAIQNLGNVLTRSGRILAFPNVMQHRVQPFRLSDPSKPGHRKILAMFLVDPHIKILSTANIPPQRRDWWAAEVRKVDRFAGLPVEIFDRIIAAVDDFPISWEMACEKREALMAERGRMTTEISEALEEDKFNFCEH